MGTGAYGFGSVDEGGGGRSFHHGPRNFERSWSGSPCGIAMLLPCRCESEFATVLCAIIEIRMCIRARSRARGRLALAERNHRLPPRRLGAAARWSSDKVQIGPLEDLAQPRWNAPITVVYDSSGDDLSGPRSDGAAHLTANERPLNDSNPTTVTDRRSPF